MQWDTDQAEGKGRATVWLIISLYAMVSLGWLSGFAVNALALVICPGLVIIGPRWARNDAYYLIFMNSAILVLGAIPAAIVVRQLIILPQVPVDSISWSYVMMMAAACVLPILAAIVLKVLVGLRGVRFTDAHL